MPAGRPGGTSGTVGRLAKPSPKPGDRLLRKQEKGLVALPNGTPLAGGCLTPYTTLWCWRKWRSWISTPWRSPRDCLPCSRSCWTSITCVSTVPGPIMARDKRKNQTCNRIEEKTSLRKLCSEGRLVLSGASPFTESGGAGTNFAQNNTNSSRPIHKGKNLIRLQIAKPMNRTAACSIGMQMGAAA